jgi:hypothetical protein
MPAKWIVLWNNLGMRRLREGNGAEGWRAQSILIRFYSERTGPCLRSDAANNLSMLCKKLNEKTKSAHCS